VNKIVQEGDKVLRSKAHEVPLSDIRSEKLNKIIRDMTETLASSEDGVAIAAPQIGESLQIFIISGKVFQAREESEEEKPDMVFINPKIVKTSKKRNPVPEGCLSVKDIQGTIERAEKVTVEAYNEKGDKFKRGASSFLAQIVQHEIDHLNGILFIDSATDIHKIERGEGK